MVMMLPQHSSWESFEQIRFLPALHSLPYQQLSYRASAIVFALSSQAVKACLRLRVTVIFGAQPQMPMRPDAASGTD